MGEDCLSENRVTGFVRRNFIIFQEPFVDERKIFACRVAHLAERSLQRIVVLKANAYRSIYYVEISI